MCYVAWAKVCRQVVGLGPWQPAGRPLPIRIVCMPHPGIASASWGACFVAWPGRRAADTAVGASSASQTVPAAGRRRRGHPRRLREPRHSIVVLQCDTIDTTEGGHDEVPQAKEPHCKCQCHSMDRRYLGTWPSVHGTRYKVHRSTARLAWTCLLTPTPIFPSDHRGKCAPPGLRAGPQRWPGLASLAGWLGTGRGEGQTTENR